jgi:hypothetical protein
LQSDFFVFSSFAQNSNTKTFMKDLFGDGGTDYAPMLFEYGQKLAVGVLILIIGLWLAGVVTKATKKLMAARGFDAALQGFLGSMVSVLK